MRYAHIVKKDGKWYEAGAEVPAETLSETEVVEDNRTYTKTDIMRMNVSDLRQLATEEGLVFDKEASGTKLKAMLLEHFGL